MRTTGLVLAAALMGAVMQSATALNPLSGTAVRASLEARIRDEVTPWSAGIGGLLSQVLEARPAESWEALPPRSLHDGNKTWCPQPNAWRFIPETITIAPSPTTGASSNFKTGCWTNVKVTASEPTSGSLEVTLEGTKPEELICGDLFVVSTGYQFGLVELTDLNPNATVKFAAWKTAGEKTWVDNNGVSVLLMPCGLVGTVESALNTVALFTDQGTQAIDANVDFLMDYGFWESPAVPYNVFTKIDKSNVKSGDYLSIIKFDGLDPLIALGTESRAGHSAVAIWAPDENGVETLWIVESTDVDPFGPAYFPPPYGIRKTKWDLWMELALNASYHVQLLPLSPELSAKYDAKAAWEFFLSIQGEPYGYHSMLLSFFDTSPQQNLPDPLDDNGTMWLLSTLDELTPHAETGVSMYAMITMPLNKRLNTTCESLSCILDYLQTINMPLSTALAIPEQDKWTYGGNVSLVCSEFAARMWLEGLKGVIPPFQGTEQTPKDNYQLNIYDKVGFNATVCPPPALRESDQGNYCQLMGPYKYTLPGYNTIVPFDHVNERCASQWPDLDERCPDGVPAPCKC